MSLCALIVLAAWIGAPIVRDILARRRGPANGRLAGEIIGAVALHTGINNWRGASKHCPRIGAADRLVQDKVAQSRLRLEDHAESGILRVAPKGVDQQAGHHRPGRRGGVVQIDMDQRLVDGDALGMACARVQLQQTHSTRAKT